MVLVENDDSVDGFALNDADCIFAWEGVDLVVKVDCFIKGECEGCSEYQFHSIYIH